MKNAFTVKREKIIITVESHNLMYKMDYKFPLLLLHILAAIIICHAQHENMPYEDVQDICKTCICLTAQDVNKNYHHMLSCTEKRFKHILARWPREFGLNHYGAEIVATFSGNTINVLQQLPATNASLVFSCRHCGIKQLQAPTFMDVPNIERLDLSWNDITSDELTPDVFRGPYRSTHYEPVALIELDLSHNRLNALDKKVFEHTPQLRKLNLSYNAFKVLSNPTTMALASAINLEELDLSHTGIKSLGAELFQTLVNLRTLNLAGNEFTTVPEHLQLIGKTLQTLNLAGNLFGRLTEQSFLGLKALRRLNISDVYPLKTIAKGTFTRLETLEHLDCSHNVNLVQFDLDSLMHCSNLTHLDVSYDSLTTLSLDMDLSPLSNNASENTNTTTLPIPWPKLRYFETIGNPWICDCGLLQTLEFAGAHHKFKETETRCDTPYFLSGVKLSNLTAKTICNMHIPRKYQAIDEDPPRFLRKRYIILTLITAAVVTAVGVMLGFVVVCIRRRLKRDDFGVEPIRYTSVRSSNLSAFSHTNTNGNIANA